MKKFTRVLILVLGSTVILGMVTIVVGMTGDFVSRIVSAINNSIVQGRNIGYVFIFLYFGISILIAFGFKRLDERFLLWFIISILFTPILTLVFYIFFVWQKAEFNRVEAVLYQVQNGLSRFALFKKKARSHNIQQDEPLILHLNHPWNELWLVEKPSKVFRIVSLLIKSESTLKSYNERIIKADEKCFSGIITATLGLKFTERFTLTVHLGVLSRFENDDDEIKSKIWIDINFKGTDPGFLMRVFGEYLLEKKWYDIENSIKLRMKGNLNIDDSY